MGLSMFPTLVPADGLNFNNVRNFTVSQSVRVTDHPVELGTDVTDHAQVLPLQLSFEVQITPSTVALPNVTTIELATAWFERNAGQLVTVTARAGIFANFVISRNDFSTTILIDRWFRVTARQVVLASGVSVPIPPRLPNSAAAAGLASEASGGVQPPIPVPDVRDLSFILALGGG